MGRGQEVRYTLSGNSQGLVAAAGAGTASLDKLGSAAAKSTARAGQFANAMGQVSTTMARSAAAFGLPVGPLRALDDVADVAALGLNNLSKAAAGFNAASLGVVGAGLAVGAAIGSWIRSFPAVAKAADDAAAALNRLFTAQKNLDNQALGAMSQKDWLARTGFSGKSVAAEMQAQKKATEEAARAASKWAEEWIRAAEAARREWDKFNATLAAGHASSVRNVATGETVAVGAAADIMKVLGQRALERADAARANAPDFLLPDQRDLSHIMRDVSLQGGGVHAAGATGASWGEDFRAGFGAAVKDLPDVVMAALQGGGNVAASVGSLFGRQIGGSLAPAVSKGLAGLLGKGLSGALGAALPGVGSLLGGLAGSLFGGLFGGGPSKEEREAARRQAEAERKRIQDLAASSRAAGIAGVAELGGAFFEGRRPAAGTVLSADDARRQGAIFAAAWGAVVKEKGIVAAAEAFGEAFKNLSADMAAAGVDLPDWLKEIGSLVELGMDESFKHIAEAANTAAKFLEALAAAGVVGEEAFRAFEQEARAAFAGGAGRAAELGADEAAATKAGFAAANPLLKALLDESIVSGTVLSADIQAMIDASGVTASINVQQLDELRQIRAAVQALAGGGGMGLAGIPPADVRDLHIPSVQRGGRVDDGREGRSDGGGLAILHPGESIVPDSKAVAFAQSVLGKSTNAGSVAAAIEALAAEVRAERTRPRDLTINVPPPDLRGAIIPRGSEDRIVERAAKEFARQVAHGGPILNAIIRQLEGRFAKK